MSSTITMSQIRSHFAATVRKETGAEVEFTLTTLDGDFSIFTLDGERFDAVVEFLSRIDGVTLNDTTKYEEDGEPTEFYAYFKKAA